MFGGVVLFVSIVLCECVPRNFYHPPMCERKGSVDCSFQMADPKNDFCIIYNTSECLNFDFSNWMKQPPRYPTTESESLFSVDVYPYALTDGKQSLFFEAVNVTITTSDKDVDGYILLLENSAVPVNICRVFDFRNSSAKGFVTLFYDCLVSLTLYNVQNFELKVKALPHNEEMAYSLFLPRVYNIEVMNICQWMPVVMVFKGALQNNIVEVKFSQAPKHFNISSYEVSLLSNQSREPVETVTVDATQDELIDVTFSHVDRGAYFVYIRPLSVASPGVCETVKYIVFSIEKKMIDHIIVIYIITVCVIGFAIAITIQLFLRWLFKPGSIDRKPAVLLVYSYDCKEHNDVVLRLAKYLENRCGIEKVFTIYGDHRADPELWLFGPYRNCDIVILIISEGVFHKCESSNSPAMKEGYPCGDRFIPSLSFLKTRVLIDKKKFIPVYFEYSGTCHIPSFIQSGKWEKTFVVPREVNYMLCEAFDQSPKISCLGVYPRMPGHDVVSCPEGMALVESIEEMKSVLNSNGDGSLMMLNECVIKNLKFSQEGDASHTHNKDKVRNHEKSKYFPKSRQPTNFPGDEERSYVGCDSKLNVPSKQWHSDYCYDHGHVCDEENCAHLNLLQDSAVGKHKSNTECSEQSIQRNAVSDVLENAEEVSTDRHMQDLQYIMSKPGPSFPSLNTLKFMK